MLLSIYETQSQKEQVKVISVSDLHDFIKRNVEFLSIDIYFDYWQNNWNVRGIIKLLEHILIGQEVNIDN